MNSGSIRRTDAALISLLSFACHSWRGWISDHVQHLVVAWSGCIVGRFTSLRPTTDRRRCTALRALLAPVVLCLSAPHAVIAFAAYPIPFDSPPEAMQLAQAPSAPMPTGFVVRGLPTIGIFQVQPLVVAPIAKPALNPHDRAGSCSAPRGIDEDRALALPSLALPPLRLPPLCSRAKERMGSDQEMETQRSADPTTPCPPESFAAAGDNCMPAGADAFVVRQALWLADPHSALPAVPWFVRLPARAATGHAK